ncbi:MAG: hypothetical protein ACXV5H_04740 [Halobacteriota archaeon]
MAAALSALNPNQWADFAERVVNVITKWNQNQTTKGFVEACEGLNLVCIDFVSWLNKFMSIYERSMSEAFPVITDTEEAAQFAEHIRSLPAHTVKEIQEGLMQKWITPEQKQMWANQQDTFLQQGPEAIESMLAEIKTLIETGTEDDWNTAAQEIQDMYNQLGITIVFDVKQLKLLFEVENKKTVRDLLLEAARESDETRRQELGNEALKQMMFEMGLLVSEVMITRWWDTITKVAELVNRLNEKCNAPKMKKFMGKHPDVYENFRALSDTTTQQFPPKLPHWEHLSDDDKLRELWIEQRDIWDFMLTVATDTGTLVRSVHAI